MEKIIIIGKGGHAKSVADIIERQNLFEIAGYIVNEDGEQAEENDYPILGRDEDLPRLFQEGISNVAMGIGFMGKSKLREKMYLKLKETGYHFPVICDPSAIVSSTAVMEEGSMIGKGAIINAGARIGRLCIINTRAVIEHDCVIEDFSHISVGAVLCGAVRIGKETFVGANATIIQGRCVESRCIIAAGAVVRKELKKGEVFQ